MNNELSGNPLFNLFNKTQLYSMKPKHQFSHNSDNKAPEAPIGQTPSKLILHFQRNKIGRGDYSQSFAKHHRNRM